MVEQAKSLRQRQSEVEEREAQAARMVTAVEAVIEGVENGTITINDETGKFDVADPTPSHGLPKPFFNRLKRAMAA